MDQLADTTFFAKEGFDITIEDLILVADQVIFPITGSIPLVQENTRTIRPLGHLAVLPSITFQYRQDTKMVGWSRYSMFFYFGFLPRCLKSTGG